MMQVNIPTVLRAHAAFEADTDTSSFPAWPLPETAAEAVAVAVKRERSTPTVIAKDDDADSNSETYEPAAKRRRTDGAADSSGAHFPDSSAQPASSAVQPARKAGDKDQKVQKGGKSAKEKQEAVKANTGPTKKEKQAQHRPHTVHFHSTAAIDSARTGKNLKSNRPLTWRDVLYGNAKDISVQPPLDEVPRDPRSMGTLFLVAGAERPLHVVVERKGAIPKGVDAHASPVWSRAMYAAGVDDPIPDELCRAVFQQRRKDESSPVERVWVGELKEKFQLERAQKVLGDFKKKLGHVVSSIEDSSLDVEAQPYALFDTVVAQVYGPAIPKEYNEEQVANIKFLGITLTRRTEYTASFGSTAVFAPTSLAEAVEGVVEKLTKGEGKFKEEVGAAVAAMLPRLSLTAGAMLGLPAKGGAGKSNKVSQLARPGRQVSEEFRKVSPNESAEFKEAALGRRVVVFQAVPVDSKDGDVLKNDEKPKLGDGNIMAVRIGNEDVEEKALPSSVTSLLMHQELRRLNLVKNRDPKDVMKLRVWAGLVGEGDAFYMAVKDIPDKWTTPTVRRICK